MKKLFAVLLLVILPTATFAVQPNSTKITPQEATMCVEYGEFVAFAAHLRDSGKGVPEIISSLKAKYPNIPDVVVAEAIMATTAFKEKSPDWINGFITGKCIGVLQTKKAQSQYITM